MESSLADLPRLNHSFNLKPTSRQSNSNTPQAGFQQQIRLLKLPGPAWAPTSTSKWLPMQPNIYNITQNTKHLIHLHHIFQNTQKN